MIVEIEEIFSDASGDISISKSVLQKWMESDDIEILGAVYMMISDFGICERIVPALEFDECFDFILRYIPRCVFEDVDSDWADGRSTALWDYAAWVKHWFAEGRDAKYLERIITGVEAMYLRADDEARLRIETAFLEHIFQEGNIRKYFSIWKADTVMAPVYKRCAVEGIFLDKWG